MDLKIRLEGIENINLKFNDKRGCWRYNIYIIDY